MLGNSWATEWLIDRLQRILTMVYVVQNYLASFGLCPSSGMWKFYKRPQCFGDWICLRPRVDQWLRLALSDGPNWIGLPCPIHLRTETDAVSETLWSFVKLPHTRRWTESKRSQIVLYEWLIASQERLNSMELVSSMNRTFFSQCYHLYYFTWVLHVNCYYL
jgi:hypothetical protein